jgi:hypothetical protein
VVQAVINDGKERKTVFEIKLEGLIHPAPATDSFERNILTGVIDPVTIGTPGRDVVLYGVVPRDKLPRMTVGTFTLHDGKGRLLGVIPPSMPREGIVFLHDRLNGRLERQSGGMTFAADGMICLEGLTITASDPEDLVELLWRQT